MAKVCSYLLVDFVDGLAHVLQPVGLAGRTTLSLMTRIRTIRSDQAELHSSQRLLIVAHNRLELLQCHLVLNNSNSNSSNNDKLARI